MSTLWVLIGPPGCGKTTYAKYHDENTVVVSRDEIRFSLLKDGEEYFSHEEEVYKKFINQINTALDEGKNVIVDQTSLTPKSRQKLLSNLGNYDACIAIWFNTPLTECIKRNKLREGPKRVPEKALVDMFFKAVKPTLSEGFDYVHEMKGSQNEYLV